MMLKLAVTICSSFYLFAAEYSPDDFPPPLRRSPASHSGMDAYILEHGTLSEKLVTMVAGSFLDDLDISENKIIELIKANPGHSNPYSGKYDAYLIALACRHGMKDTVQAIVENNQASLNCLSADCTPLDEAIEFSQREVAQYLFEKGAKMSIPNSSHYNRLLQS